MSFTPLPTNLPDPAEPGSPPFKRLLVPLDGSPLAERALPFAKALAHLCGSDLILVRTATLRGPYSDAVAAQVKAAAEAETYLERVATDCHPDFAPEVSVPYGDPVHEIADIARVREADLIVMTTHGRSGLGRLMLGSVAEGLVRRSAQPLLLIRAGLPLRRWEQGLHRLLVPLDGGAEAERVLPRVAALARAANARVSLLQVIGQGPSELTPYEIYYLPEDQEVRANTARTHLAEVVADLRARGIDADAELQFGSPGACITAAAAQHQYDLIVMNTQSRNRLDRLVAGSVTDDVLRAASVPVLMFHE